MPAQETTPFTLSAKIEPERALRLGAAAAVAPLWAAYFAAASTGMAYWWMTAWTRQGEQKSFAPKALAQPVKTVVEIAEAPVEAVVEAVEAVQAAPKAELTAVEAPVAKPAPAKPVVTAAAKPAAPKAVPAKTAPKPTTVRPKS